jgi:hypothetical protein
MSDELERIRRYRADEPAASRHTIDSARADLTGAIRSVATPVRPRRRAPRAVGLLAAAAIAAVVALALGTGSSAPTPALAATLHHLADVAAQQSPVVAPHTGQYLYVDSVNANDSDAYANGRACIALVPEHRQIWIAANGAGRLLETDGPPTFATPHDHAVCDAMHATPQPGTSDNWFASGCLTIGFADKIPAASMGDPGTLLAELRKLDGGPLTPAEDFVHIGDVLRESDASPALRAAVYRAAATIPGVKLLGPTKDHLGRAGVGIGYPGGGALHELILDPRTSALLGEQTVDTATGRVLDWDAYRTSKIVNGIPVRAPGRLAPPCVNGGGYDHEVGNGVSITTGAPAGAS